MTSETEAEKRWRFKSKTAMHDLDFLQFFIYQVLFVVKKYVYCIHFELSAIIIIEQALLKVIVEWPMTYLSRY